MKATILSLDSMTLLAAALLALAALCLELALGRNTRPP